MYLLSVAWQPKLERLKSLDIRDGTDHNKVAKVGRPATDYVLVVRP